MYNNDMQEKTMVTTNTLLNSIIAPGFLHESTPLTPPKNDDIFIKTFRMTLVLIIYNFFE